MKNTISIHNNTIFNKEHDFRKGNRSYPFIDAEKSKYNVYFEKNEILKEDESKAYQLVISFNGDYYNEEILRNALIEYLETFEKRHSLLKVNYGAVHCDEKNMLPHLHLTYTYVSQNYISFNFEKQEKEYINSLLIANHIEQMKQSLLL